MIAAHELGLADRIETVRTVVAMAQVNPVLLPDNPLGKIPTLVLDDGSVLFDSLVIIEYLDSLAGPLLFPAPGPARWTALTWHALGTGFLDALILWRNERDKPVGRQTPEWIAAFTTKTDATLDRLEALVPVLAVAPFGIGHIAIGCALGYLDFRFQAIPWREGHPKLAGWYEAFAARPSVAVSQVAEG